MNKDLTMKLVRRFPVIYQDYYSPMSQTCMCWGFDHGDGWFEIIWQLSLAIEEELGYSRLQERTFLFKKSFAALWNKLIYKLSPVRLDERKWVDGQGLILVKKAERTWDAKIAQRLLGNKKLRGFEIERIGLKEWAITSWNYGFRVGQVKEKFGTLRFYCGGTPAIDRYVRLAERLSAITCDVCGKSGRLSSNNGWYRTLCKADGGEVEAD